MRHQRWSGCGHAHSSNNLVTPDGGVVMLTEGMNRIVHLDEADMTVTVQCGAALMALDAWLSELGLGLPIVGDHDHITAAGFASVGGISPASHRHGMFVDTVVELEYVDWDGKVHRCSRQHSRPELLRLLAGTGRHGVITELTITVIKADKYHTVYANQRRITASLDEFVSYSGRMIGDPGDAVAERGVWADLEVPGLSGASVRLAEVMLYLGLRPERMTPEVLDRLVRKIAEITIAHQAVRYMHSLTSSDPTVRAKVDPNTRYSGSSADAPTPAARQSTAAAKAGRPPKAAPASVGEQS